MQIGAYTQRDIKKLKDTKCEKSDVALTLVHTKQFQVQQIVRDGGRKRRDAILSQPLQTGYAANVHRMCLSERA